MAKANVNDIFKNLLPEKSRKVYDKAYAEFIDFVGTDSPGEDDSLQYFQHLYEKTWTPPYQEDVKMEQNYLSHWIIIFHIISLRQSVFSLPTSSRS